MRKTKPKGQERVTRGFTLDEDGQDGTQETPRRVRTRQQIMNGEGKRPPASVPLAELAHNPFNPRDEYTDIEETAESLRTRGQVQPVTVARRAAFLRAHPDQEELLGTAEYVVIDGNRRLKAAIAAGLAELRIDVNDDLAATAADILESALIANVHRVDVPPLDQAKAIQQLVDVHGSQGKVAKRLGKTPAWVSQRLALLELTPDLQSAVEAGELKVEPARRIGRLPKAQQAPAAQEAMAASKTPRQRAPRRQLGGGGEGPTVNGVNGSGVSGSDAAVPQQSVNAVNTPAVAASAPSASIVISDTSPPGIVATLKQHLSPQDFTKVTELLVESLTESATG
ncbi:ParB/RepB/Spo0J family partition protein [Streptomyces tendae]|uniref:ParB/RepB/Spo0J family partition protein n=1 Tax=Streptomyces tendae TaxID=1932 RepID=A0A6B3QWP5_STRTE|nr:ParB/RepB/Spo0J family partition protein [Streptomyces tendae]NEV92486.1 ParB/RepB/Spo0J family partition protein [Streptomyces tendae]